jgi:hypothetical protein
MVKGLGEKKENLMTPHKVWDFEGSILDKETLDSFCQGVNLG